MEWGGVLTWLSNCFRSLTKEQVDFLFTEARQQLTDLRKEVKELKEEVEACHEDRLAEKAWRLNAEAQFPQLRMPLPPPPGVRKDDAGDAAR